MLMLPMRQVGLVAQAAVPEQDPAPRPLPESAASFSSNFPNIGHLHHIDDPRRFVVRHSSSSASVAPETAVDAGPFRTSLRAPGGMWRYGPRPVVTWLRGVGRPSSGNNMPAKEGPTTHGAGTCSPPLAPTPRLSTTPFHNR
jgi:hypothetical protein